MINTFENLPENIEKALSVVLSGQGNNMWIKRSEFLHTRYMENNADGSQQFLHDSTDVLAYLAMRVPATYAQIVGALNQTVEMLPNWQPITLLDIGSGPGTAVWAANHVWPTIQEATCIDSNQHMISFGQHIATIAAVPPHISWMHGDIRSTIRLEKKYDVVIIANTLNELAENEREKLIRSAYALCSGILLIVEPGTPTGSKIIEDTGRTFEETQALLAPYIANSFVQKGGFWMHFAQKFNRPDFQRRVRQHLRDSSLMASDVEEAKFAYVAISKLKSTKTTWGRVVRPIKKQKGFLEIPILTHEKIEIVKVMQRHKKEYTFAKELKWGQLIQQKELIVNS